MSERTGYWVYAKNMFYLNKVIDKLSEYLFDVQYEIIHKCKCGRIEVFIHYIV